MTSLSRPGSLGVDQRLRAPRNFDWYLLFSACALLLVGLLSLYSTATARGTKDFSRQLLFVFIGIVPFSIFAFVKPKFWMRISPVLYVINLLALAAVLMVGAAKKGAVRWIEVGPLQFQPSEMAKILVVLTLASFFAMRQDKVDRLSTFVLSFVHVLIPMGLIIQQPHLGATLVMMVIWLSISFAANVPIKFIFGAIFTGVAALVMLFAVPSIGRLVLKDYHLGRVEGLLFKQDEKGADYQTLRAQIAFAAGGVMGSGFMKGEQKTNGYVPEQNTDFIFTVIGEEGGLIGAGLVLFIYGVFFYRVWLVMLNAQEPYYRMIASGVLGLLAFHTIVNLYMVTQMLPVVGLWLPFLSYGGTALWLCMGCVGLLLNIKSKEKPVLF